MIDRWLKTRLLEVRTMRKGFLWWAVPVLLIGLAVFFFDHQILMAINPNEPIPALDGLVNFYTDICGPAIGLPCLVLVLSLIARTLRPRGWLGYPALCGLVLMGVFAKALTEQGSERVLILVIPPLFLALGWILSGIDRPGLEKAEKVALASAISIALAAGLVTQQVKDAAQRPRPRNPANQMEQDLRGFEVENLTGFQSFPSGHSSGAWSLCFPIYLALRNRKSGLAFMILPLLTSLSRVYLAVHFPTDVYVGALLGLAGGVVSSWIVFGPSMGSFEDEV